MGRKGRDQGAQEERKAEDDAQINSESQVKQYVQPAAQDTPG